MTLKAARAFMFSLLLIFQNLVSTFFYNKYMSFSEILPLLWMHPLWSPHFIWYCSSPKGMMTLLWKVIISWLTTMSLIWYRKLIWVLIIILCLPTKFRYVQVICTKLRDFIQTARSHLQNPSINILPFARLCVSLKRLNRMKERWIRGICTAWFAIIYYLPDSQSFARLIGWPS